MMRLGLTVACLAILLAGLALPPPARAGGGLVLSSHTRYEVRPADRLIAVAVDIAATNVVADTASGRTYFTGISVPIPAAATNVFATSNQIPLAVAISPLDELSVMADITFSSGVFYRQTYPLRLSFTIADGGGDPTRETWVRSSFVAFAAWAIGSDGPASVEVVLPAGYAATDHLAAMEVIEEPTATRLFVEGVDPTEFFAYVTAEHEGERLPTTLQVPMRDTSATVVLSAWPDDPEWAPRLGGWLEAGLPVLEDQIGLAYPVRRELRVEEHAYHHLGDYAGYFARGTDTIAVRFDADAFLTLHEAAHVWFNSALATERWVLEGFASYYAEVAGTEIGAELQMYELTDEVREHAFALTDWGVAGREDLDREDYGYAASHEVARRIAAVAGEDGLQAVWRATFDERRAYALSDDEVLEDGEVRMAEWQRFLDLFEIETGADYTAIWTEWVIGERDAELLDERAEARAAYAATLESLEGWTMPLSTRLAMEWWDFDDATAELTEVEAVIAAREALEAEAGAMALVPSNDLRRAFEESGPAAAAAEATAQAAALRAIGAADSAVGRPLEPVEEIGLLWEIDPADRVAEARDAFEAGDEGAAERAAREGVDGRAQLAERGRTRVLVAGGSILAVDIVALGVLLGLRRRRRSRAAIA